jgi:hypothetical protein
MHHIQLLIIPRTRKTKCAVKEEDLPKINIEQKRQLNWIYKAGIPLRLQKSKVYLRFHHFLRISLARLRIKVTIRV